MKSIFKRLLSFALCFVIVFAFAGCGKKEDNTTTKQTQTTTQVAMKNISVVVVDKNNEKKEFNIKTRDKYLRGALDQEKLIKGEKGDYGLMVTTVDGYTADSSKQEWWCFIQNGKSCEKGVDQTEIKDGDKIEIQLKVGY